MLTFSLLHIPIIIVVVIFLSEEEVAGGKRNSPIGSPFLLYPKDKATYEFIFGVGIPTEGLQLESVTTGMVFKMRYGLPKADGKTTSTSRQMNSTNGGTWMEGHWSFYKLMEQWAYRIGLDGRSCLLKSLCEVAQDKTLLSHSGHLWYEIAYILLRPQTLVDELPSDLLGEGNEVLVATATNVTCSQLYPECPRSLLSYFIRDY